MSDICVCGHEPCCCAERCYCGRYTRSPLSAFRGPAVRMSREEAAGWLRALREQWAADRIDGSRIYPSDLRAMACDLAKRARRRIRGGEPRAGAEAYLAARILRAVRP